VILKIYPSEVANKATLWEDSRRQPQGHAVATSRVAAIAFAVGRRACKKGCKITFLLGRFVFKKVRNITPNGGVPRMMVTINPE